MQKFFIVFSETGEYSDYSKINLYVSSSKELAQKYCDDKNEELRSSKEASIELQALIDLFEEEQRGSYKNDYKSYWIALGKFIEEKQGELALKYIIDKDKIERSGDYHFPKFLIEEIDGD